MHDGLLFERSGSGDDTELLVRVCMRETGMHDLAFDTHVGVGGLGLARATAALSEFAAGCLAAGGHTSMQLVLGPDLESSPHAVVQLKTLEHGYVSVAVQLWRPVPGYPPHLTDMCKLHFATDIASLDAFTAQCHAICEGHRHDAGLIGLRLPSR